MKTRYLAGIVIGIIGLSVNVAFSLSQGICGCGPFITIILGIIVGFWAVKGEKPVSQKAGAGLGATAGLTAGAILFVSEIVVTTILLPHVGKNLYSLDSIKTWMQAATDIFIGICMGGFDMIVMATVGAFAGHLASPSLNSSKRLLPITAILLTVVCICVLALLAVGFSFQFFQSQAVSLQETPNTVIPLLSPEKTIEPPVNSAEMITIPAGNFQAGCDYQKLGLDGCTYLMEHMTNPEDKVGRLPELQSIYLDAFEIDKYEVTNARYAACVKMGGCTAPEKIRSATRNNYYGNPEYGDYPVVNVTWMQAQQYCYWAGKRLPTRAEWLKAASGDTGTRQYPWGDDAPTCERANISAEKACVGDTAKVGSYSAGASPYGLLDMAGNAAEWVADWYQWSFFSAINPQGPSQGALRAVMGGSWKSTDVRMMRNQMPTMLISAYGEQGYHAEGEIGFRCAKAPGDRIREPATAIPTPVFKAGSPQDGKANIVGRVMTNNQPVSQAEVMVCDHFEVGSSSGCTGKTTQVTTDAQGIFTFLNLEPGSYAVLFRFPATETWFFNKDDSMFDFNNPVLYSVSAGQTLQLEDVFLEQFDLKLISPADEEILSSALTGQVLTLTWEPYRGAEVYIVTFHDNYGLNYNEIIYTNSLTIAVPLTTGVYSWSVEALNAQWIRISSSAERTFSLAETYQP